ncbi:hypothetical protein GTCCBUS3UF5_17180 [Geobacillus thermoleovorans CCB_US3_UF5]|uniref:Uncharacterized protein n=1 Tax=Geobacillus thermoleovorans CCB_US3_UF5 TaxID=1111068 RepID=A0ABM5MH86_GEOTH|nr:hypothetical protein GTCCBUS3UF5_17180 [Geobacillus thermoleovorans CCB_US3_UF5]OQP13858.1 hypothetical protein B1692_05665 [Geobacillus thermoleovorans]
MKAKKQSSSPFSVSILSAIQPSIWKKWIWEPSAKGDILSQCKERDSRPNAQVISTETLFHYSWRPEANRTAWVDIRAADSLAKSP